MSDRMKDFLSALDAGYDEATAAGSDKIANTKVIIKQVREAEDALGKAIAFVAKTGGLRAVSEAYVLGTSVMDVFDEYPYYMNASIVLALALELMAQFDLLVEAAEDGIKEEESKATN